MKESRKNILVTKQSFDIITVYSMLLYYNLNFEIKHSYLIKKAILGYM